MGVEVVTGDTQRETERERQKEAKKKKKKEWNKIWRSGGKGERKRQTTERVHSVHLFSPFANLITSFFLPFSLSPFSHLFLAFSFSLFAPSPPRSTLPPLYPSLSLFA